MKTSCISFLVISSVLVTHRHTMTTADNAESSRRHHRLRGNHDYAKRHRWDQRHYPIHGQISYYKIAGTCTGDNGIKYQECGSGWVSGGLNGKYHSFQEGEAKLYYPLLGDEIQPLLASTSKVEVKLNNRWLCDGTLYMTDVRSSGPFRSMDMSESQFASAGILTIEGGDGDCEQVSGYISYHGLHAEPGSAVYDYDGDLCYV